MEDWVQWEIYVDKLVILGCVKAGTFLRNWTSVNCASKTPCLWCRVLISLWQIFLCFSCHPSTVRFAYLDVCCPHILKLLPFVLEDCHLCSVS